MSHSVSQHLRIDLADYDATIRRFIRSYDEMLEQAVGAVTSSGPLDRVLDLGAGTGALSERLLERHPTCTVELWDVDRGMLEQASQRLKRFGERVVLRESSFFEVEGPVDAMMASLSLHHVRDLATKEQLYTTLARSLRPGGRLVNADVTIPEDEAERRAEYQAWAAHQVANGYTETEAFQHFEEWAEEDRYFSLEEEQSALTRAGLRASCVWRQAPSTVTVAIA